MGGRLATIEMDRKLVEAVLLFFFAGGSWSQSNTMWPGPTFVSSFTLIHLTVWPQYTNVTDGKTDRQDNGPIA